MTSEAYQKIKEVYNKIWLMKT